MNVSLTATEKEQIDVTEVLLQPDVQKALTDMAQLLPKLAPFILLAGKGLDAAWAAMTDAELMGGLEEMVLEKAQPARQKIAEAKDMCREAKARAERSHQYIGLFGILRLLKDPSVQYALRYTQALTEIVSEHRRTNRSVAH